MPPNIKMTTCVYLQSLFAKMERKLGRTLFDLGVCWDRGLSIKEAHLDCRVDMEMYIHMYIVKPKIYGIAQIQVNLTLI